MRRHDMYISRSALAYFLIALALISCGKNPNVTAPDAPRSGDGPMNATNEHPGNTPPILPNTYPCKGSQQGQQTGKCEKAYVTFSHQDEPTRYMTLLIPNTSQDMSE